MTSDGAPASQARRAAPPIYVEIRIRGDFEDLWKRTQNPDLHERWDLRFTKIDYLSRDDDTAPQRFRYSRRFGPVTISGVGETVGERRRADGAATSALRFWSDDPRSLIKSGSGYWRYVPTEDGIRFLTRYDYDVRWGAVGRLFDRLLWRPLMGWGTAWSFDRLRLWVEEGIEPEASLGSAVTADLPRISLGLAWLYQGLVPKLLDKRSGEVELVEASGAFPGRERAVVTVGGITETAFGAYMRARRRRWPFAANLVILPLLAGGAFRSRPDSFTKAFNPVAVTVAMMGLAAIGYLADPKAPTAARCLREPPEGGA